MADSPLRPLSWAGLVRQKPPNAVPVNTTPPHLRRKYLVNPQRDSKLMTIPQEMRDKILAYLFQSTRLTWGMNYGTKPISPNKNHELAILRTCRAMLAQAGDKWIGQVTMNFMTADAAVFKLGHITVEVRRKIRHLQMPGSFINNSGFPFYRPDTSYILGMLPGLSLDKLIIISAGSGSLALLDWIVRKGDGWKECHYLAETCEFLAEKVWYGKQAVEMVHSQVLPDQYIFEGQLKDWQGVLEKRDGASSQPSIKLYLAQRTDRASSFVPSFLAAPENEFDQVEGAVMDPVDVSKEVLVVIKRGKAAEYTLKGTKTWREVDDEVQLAEDPLGKKARSVRSTRLDNYSHPEEFMWNQDKPDWL